MDRPQAPNRGGPTVSRSVDLFIDSDLPLTEVAARVTAVTQIPVAADADGRFVVSHEEVHAELGEHRYVDDGDLWLSRYRYALSARVATDANPKDSAEAGLLRRMAQALHRDGPFAVLLVLDLQYRDLEPATAPADGNGDA